jgi:hypothetical protein
VQSPPSPLPGLEPAKVSAELRADVSLATIEATPSESLVLSSDGTLLAFVGVKFDPSVVFIFNFFEELRRIAPTAKK